MRERRIGGKLQRRGAFVASQQTVAAVAGQVNDRVPRRAEATLEDP
jgi:hypothetical protein